MNDIIKSKSKFMRNMQSQIFTYLDRSSPYIPLKFQYIGKGAQRWEELTKYEEFISQDECKLLKNSAEDIAHRLKRLHPKLKSLRVVDIGCGTGKKAFILLKCFKKFFPKVKFKYYPLDISEDMLSIAIKEISKLDISLPKKKLRKYLIDFETELLAPKIRENRKKRTVDFLLFLGNTLGNVENPDSLVEKIKESMRPKMDLFLLEVELPPNSSLEKERLMKIYNSEFNIKFISTALEYFGISPVQLNKKGCGKIITEFKNSQLQQYFQFIKEKKISLSTGESIKFNKGSKILLARSRRFSCKEIEDLLMEKNLEVIKIYKRKFSSLFLSWRCK